MDFDQVSCQREIRQELPPEKSATIPLHQEAYGTKTLDYPATAVNGSWNLPGVDLVQEGKILGIMLDGGNAQLVAARLQNDLLGLRPDRNAQNFLLNQVSLNDRKGIGSDLILGYYDARTGSYMQRYIIPSASRPYPTYPLIY
jgi:hypothetical protein